MSIISNEISNTGFDYNSLTPAVADNAKAAAEHIRDILRNTTAGIIEVGERLQAIKDSLPHGQFTSWIAAEFGMSHRAARLYMSAAEFAAGKTETVSVLQPTTVYALAAPSTPEAIKTGVLERLDRGEVIGDREIKQLIAQEKGLKRVVTERAVEPKENFTVPVREILDTQVNCLLPEPINTVSELIVVDAEIDRDPLEAAIHAVMMLSSDDRTDFDRWYRDTFAPLPPDPLLSNGDIVEAVPRPDATDIEDDLLISEWRAFKPNSQKCCRKWVLDGSPAEVSPNEHFQITERLAPWRDAYRGAPLERQESIRRWFEQQNSDKDSRWRPTS